MPILNTIGNHFSHILHNLIFSFPSPNGTSPDVLSTPDHLDPIIDGIEAGMSSLDGMMREPGEPRALAGGVGPLSFVGSGYGVMLILMVSRPLLALRRLNLASGNPVESHTSYRPSCTTAKTSVTSPSGELIIRPDACSP